MTGVELLLALVGGFLGLIAYVGLGVVSYLVVDRATDGYLSEIFRTSPEYVMRAADHIDPAAGPLFALFILWPLGALIALIALKLSQAMNARC